MKVVSVIGARPQFIKAATITRLIRRCHKEILVHTGQHYDNNMSAVFFDELGILTPEYNLCIGSGSHGLQTGAMLVEIEKVLLKEGPDWVVVYGDTNSTLAGALAAAKLNIPVAHVESGLRSYNRKMPEEINRVIVDHLSDLLFCPSQVAVDNLAIEGIRIGVHLVGDVMLDTLQYVSGRTAECRNILQHFDIQEKDYILVTIHRAENTDNINRLESILAALNEANELIVFSVHPRTQKALQRLVYSAPKHVKLIEPVSYQEMVCLESMARMVLTDSGGIQKEAYWLKTPCITLRDETEWIETVEVGWNILVGTDSQRILAALSSFTPPENHPPLYGEPGASERCVKLLEKYSKTSS